VAYSEDLHEQMDWIAEDISDWGGDAWVLPVGDLSQAEEKRIVELAARRASGPRTSGRYPTRGASATAG
jgi:hypothetical protein